MDNQELERVLREHKDWLAGNDNGKLANLSYADLHGANLHGANLRYANLRGANLRYANLRDADLSDAGLSGANLRGANLHGANLRYANLRGANMRDAGLSYANLPTFQLPAGELIVFKKLMRGRIATLRIDTHTPRTATLIGRKCRAASAFVLAIEGFQVDVAEHDGTTEYKVGQYVYPDSYNDDPRIECTNGIHFFCTREEAEQY